VEFPPLLSAGLHQFTLDQLRQMCVANFPLSGTRSLIMDGLKKILDRVLAANISSGAVWVNGSFLTGKIDPNDVDFVVCVDADIYDNGTVEQKAILDSIANDDLKSSDRCDCYVSLAWPSGHALHGVGQRNRDYWKRQFGNSRSGEAKGIAALNLGSLRP
jgi:hypothetical protein